MLLIADISGYTDYVHFHRGVLGHAKADVERVAVHVIGVSQDRNAASPSISMRSKPRAAATTLFSMPAVAVGTLITHNVSLDAARAQLGHALPGVTGKYYVAPREIAPDLRAERNAFFAASIGEDDGSLCSPNGQTPRARNDSAARSRRYPAHLDRRSVGRSAVGPSCTGRQSRRRIVSFADGPAYDLRAAECCGWASARCGVRAVFHTGGQNRSPTSRFLEP